MKDWSNRKKKQFIKSHNIPVYETSRFPINKLLKFALVKDAIELDCFGYCDPESSICKKCYLFENNYCKSFTKYLSQLEDQSVDDAITVVEYVGKVKESKIMSLDYSMEKLGFQSKRSASYKIAKVILDSNNKPYGDVIKKISSIMKGTTHAAQIRFYQIRKRIEERLGFQVSIITTKYVQIKDTNNA